MAKVIGALVALLIVSVGTIYLLWPEEGHKTSHSEAIVRGNTEIAAAPVARDERTRMHVAGPNEWIEPGELLVSDPPRGFGVAAKEMGFSIIESTRLEILDMAIYRLKIPAGMDEMAARRKIATHFPGVTADTHRLYGIQQGAADPYRKNLARPRAGWDASPATCGTGLRIGMIDAPIDVQHEALRGQKIKYLSFHRTDRALPDAEHGTAVAAMLVGRPEWGGLLPGAQLFAANMFELNDTGRMVGSGMGLLKAIEWLARSGAKVINLSIAGGDNEVVKKAMEKAARAGLVLVAAAGNWGSAERIAYPAAYGEAIGVTAFGDGYTIYVKANRGDYIDFAAPGVDIFTAVPNGGQMQSGTSFATPYITALTAVILHQGLANSAEEIRRLLSPHAKDLGKPGRDDVFGWGVINGQPPCPQ